MADNKQNMREDSLQKDEITSQDLQPNEDSMMESELTEQGA